MSSENIKGRQTTAQKPLEIPSWDLVLKRNSIERILSG
jgi:hypothetical protein